MKKIVTILFLSSVLCLIRINSKAGEGTTNWEYKNTKDAHSVELSSSPLNPDFQAYVAQHREGKTHQKSVRARGYVPHPIDFSHLAGKRLFPMLGRKKLCSYPSQYDLRDLGAVPPVCNQLQYGMCWSFAALASVESYLLKKKSEIADYSE